MNRVFTRGVNLGMLTNRLYADTVLSPSSGSRSFSRRFLFRVLRDEQGSFYLGNIAPDAQNVAGLSRESTHFFEVPMRDASPAWEVMFNQYPSLRHTYTLTPAQRLFLPVTSVTWLEIKCGSPTSSTPFLWTKRNGKTP